MALRYTRRPILGGNARELIQSQPSIRGQVRRNDLTLQFPGMVTPASMGIEIDGGAPILVNFPTLSINTIVTALNTALGPAGSAEDRGGYIVISSATSGDGSSVEIVDSGVNDASAVMGFPISPDPLALVEGGDRSYSPAGGTEDNPVGTFMAADGEVVTSDVVNRIAGALAFNADYLNACLEREVALPMILDVDSVTLGNPWFARVVQDGSGNIDQLNVGGLSAVDAGMSDRVYLGMGLSNSLSSLLDIADYFAVTDEGRAEIIVGGETVRISAVTHGQRSGAAPTFVDEVSPPAAAVPSVVSWSPLSGRGLLGTNVEKVTSIGIAEILYRSAIRCTGATFLTSGVVPGDLAVISGATNLVPFSHNDTYTVEQVFDEETILLRPQNPGDRGELNDTPGVFGNVQIFQGGLFSEDVWLTFDPPIPATAGTAKFKLMMGGGYSLCSLPTDHLLRIALSTAEEVDDLVQKVIREMKGPLVDSTDDFTKSPFAQDSPLGNEYDGEPDVSMELLWRRISLQGAYDGQGRGGGGGYFVNVDWNPPEWNNLTPGVPQAGASNRVGVTATIQAGNVVYIVGEKFTLDDVGREFMVIPGGVGGSLLNYQSFVIIDYLDVEHVVVEPGENNPSIPSGGSYSYSIMERRFNGFPAAMSTHVLQSTAYGRLGYVHEEDRTIGGEFGHHFLGVRESATHETSVVPMDVFPGMVFPGGDNTVLLPPTMDPSLTSNIRAFVDDTKDPSITPSIIRITEDQGNDGWYVVTRIEGGTRKLHLQNFDGSRPVFTASATARGHLYLPTQGFALLRYLASDPGFADSMDVRIANLFFDDAKEWAEDRAPGVTAEHMGVIGVDWRGTSAGVVMRLNDADFASQDPLDTLGLTVGTATDIESSQPARGYFGKHFGNPVGPNPLKRGGWAGTLIADTYSMDATQAGTPAMQGTALYMAQMGTDSAFVAVGWQNGGAHSTPPNPDDITFVDGKATGVIVREDEWSMMQGGALEIMGGVYQWDPNSFWPSGGNLSGRQMYGGIYTELAQGSRFSNSPIHVDKLRYYNVADDSKKRILARLGQPGQTKPYYEGDPNLALAEVKAPDPARSRSHRSSGFLTVGTNNAKERFEHPSTYIGQQIDVAFTDGANAGNSGLYVIINVRLGDTVVPGPLKNAFTFEVLHKTFTLIDETPPADHKVIIRGGRWHWANIDIESWMAIGTYRTADPARVELDEFLGCGILGTPDLSMIDMGYYPFDTGHAGMLADPGLGLNDYSFGLGTNPDISGLLTSFAARAPIANAAWSPYGAWTLASQADVIAQADFPKTSLLTSEWFLREAGNTSTLRAMTDFRDIGNDLDNLGQEFPALMIEWSGGVANVTQTDMRALTRVTHRLLKHHFRVRVRVVMRWYAPSSGVAATKNISARLVGVDENFTVSTVHGDTLTRNVTKELDFFLTPPASAFDLREAPSDALKDSVQAILNFDLGETRMDGGEAATEKIFIYSCHVTLEAVDVHHGLLINEGPVVASGFHLSGTALDYKSYGPADAAPYAGTGFGAELPWWHQGAHNAPESGLAGKIDPISMSKFEGGALGGTGGAGATWTADQGYLDIVPPSFFWRRGSNDACFSYVGRRFAAGARHSTPDAFDAFSSMPGHIIRLDPPHGSIMVTLRVATSIFNSITNGVYRSAVCDEGVVVGADPGFVIELYRHSVLPAGDSGERVYGTATLTAVDFGFSELIARVEVDVDGTAFSGSSTPHMTSSEKDCADVQAGTQDDLIDGCVEDFYLTAIDLMGSIGGHSVVSDKTMLFIDRRQYAYSFAVRAWGEGNGTEMQLIGTGQTDGTGRVIHTFGARLEGSAVDPGWTHKINMFSKLKFRGATMACNYTRMNP